jgi:hypothetical protein
LAASPATRTTPMMLLGRTGVVSDVVLPLPDGATASGSRPSTWFV